MSRGLDTHFRRLRHEDLPLMHQWLNRDFVVQWYGKRPRSWQEVVDKYAARIEGRVPTAPFLILLGDRAIGYIHSYRLVDYPDYNRFIGAGAEVAGVDLFIGEADCIHRGWGSLILRQFVQQIVFADRAILTCVVGPEPDNRVALRAYEKAGFRFWKSIRTPEESCWLMRVDRGGSPPVQ